MIDELLSCHLAMHILPNYLCDNLGDRVRGPGMSEYTVEVGVVIHSTLQHGL